MKVMKRRKNGNLISLALIMGFVKFLIFSSSKSCINDHTHQISIEPIKMCLINDHLLCKDELTDLVPVYGISVVIGKRSTLFMLCVLFVRPVKAKKRGNGFTKLCQLSPKLGEFIGTSQLARTEVNVILFENGFRDVLESNFNFILCHVYIYY